ncbi:MAG: hypothetical protein RLZZ127_246 [Planctomycetota bacterium]
MGGTMAGHPHAGNQGRPPRVAPGRRQAWWEAMPDAAALSVTFAPGGLREVVAMLHRLRADGALRVQAGEDHGAVTIEAGQVRAAFFNSLSGPQALSRLLLSGPGRAWVDPLAPVYEPNLAGDTADILARIDRVLAELHFDRLFGAAGGTAPAKAPEPQTTALTAADLDSALGAEPLAADDPLLTMRTALLPPQVGSLLGRCLLKRELGAGASSVVYLAHHTALDVDVVVKVLIPGQGGADAATLTTNEARTLARLNHPGILRVFDYDDTDRFPHLVVEHIAGGSLQDALVAEGPLDPVLVAGVMRQAAKALAYAQARIGLVHGDIKPANILLRDDGRATLIDFGIAAIAAGKTAKPVVGTAQFRRQVRGTPSYLAPELVDGDAPAWASDCYALGCTAYHALAGRPPYQDPDPVKLMLLHKAGGFVPLDLLRKDLEPALVQIVHRCLAMDPAQRYPAPGALVADLESLRAGQPLAAGEPDPRKTTFWQHLSRAVRRA